MTTPAHPSYSLEQADDDLADVRGQVTIMGEAHTKTDASDQPATPASGLISYSSAGQEKYVSSDGNAYNTGRLTLPATGSLTLTTSMQTMPGLSAALAVGTYRVHAQLLVKPGASAGGAMSYQVSASGGLTAANGRVTVTEIYASNQVDLAEWAVLGGTLTGSATLGAGGADRVVTFDGLFIVTVAGTLSVQASQGATATATILQYGSYLEILPAS